MTFENNSTYPLFFVPLTLLFLGTLLVQPSIGRSQTKTQINPREEKMARTDELTEKQGKYLLKVARETIDQELLGGKETGEPIPDFPPVFQDRRGTFVTLSIGGNLRGCIGHITPEESLIDGIKVNAINAAFRDPRFHPITRDEWKKVRIEISILTNPEPLDYTGADNLLEQIQHGIDGLIIKKGFNQATFLPQVWEQLPEKEEFLAHLCLKAGLKGNAWKKGGLEISTYQVQAFEE
jgi:AmmeMemoRadiSam system protein A